MFPTPPRSIERPADHCRHPGERLAEELATIGMSVAALARSSGIPLAYLAEIVARRRAVTTEVALRLADHLGTSARFWLNLQATYERAIRYGDQESSSHAR